MPKGPWDNEANIPIVNIKIVDIMAAFSLLILNLSIPKDTTASNIDMVLVRAAKANNKKNSIPNIYPPGIWGNTLGNVTNTRPGPLSGSIPKANTTGNIAIPAKIAIKVSAIAIFKAEEPNLSLFLI